LSYFESRKPFHHTGWHHRLDMLRHCAVGQNSAGDACAPASGQIIAQLDDVAVFEVRVELRSSRSIRGPALAKARYYRCWWNSRFE
jgi:hypothetical protein